MMSSSGGGVTANIGVFGGPLTPPSSECGGDDEFGENVNNKVCL